MQLLKTVEQVRTYVKACKLSGKSIGLVPTMGFLHQGHFSLIEKAKSDNDLVIVSIFVNPAQFAPDEDLGNYPRDLDRDLKNCEALGVDAVFNPETETMYNNFRTYVSVEELDTNLCGKDRPGHFRGVCTVVTKLFNITKADRSYFGEKDIQQLSIIKKMVKDLNFDIEIIGCPTVREADGLALSSRNKYLNPNQRQDALCLSRALKKGQTMMKKGLPVQQLINAMAEIISDVPSARIDYIEVVEPGFLQPITIINGPAIVAVAVRIGSTRLLDNFIYQGD